MNEDKAGQGDLRILVVDDNLDAAFTLSTLLRLEGHHTSTAHNGLDAIQATTRDRFDAVLLDLGMPVMDGFGAAAVIRQLQPAPVLIACSGWNDATTRRRTAELGFSAHLTKPVDLGTLKAVLRLAHEARQRRLASGHRQFAGDETQAIADPNQLGE